MREAEKRSFEFTARQFQPSEDSACVLCEWNSRSGIVGYCGQTIQAECALWVRCYMLNMVQVVFGRWRGGRMVIIFRLHALQSCTLEPSPFPKAA